MIGRGLFVLTILSNCVLSLPVTPSQLENEDVKVMKCIVEALADVLSRPHPMPVSQECLVTLKTDDRLVSILRHHTFLKELREIAVQGGQGRAQLQRDTGAPEPTTQSPQTADDVADRSMLEALGGPGERSILSQKKRTGNRDGKEDKDVNLRDDESQEDVAEEVQEKRGNDESPGSHISESVDEWSEGKAEKRGEEEEEEYEEKRVNSEEENMIKDKKGDGSGEKRNAPRIKSKEKKFDKEDEGETNKRSAFLSHRPKQEEQQEEEEEEEDEGEMKRESSRESLKRWTKRGKLMLVKKAQQLNSQQKVQHHSKEVPEEEEKKKKKKKRNTQRSQEEKELQMIARRGPEERRVLEEEGSASRKSEEPEIESLAAIESELENVAQKLHEMRRG
ncbi:chromogranin-A [Sander vitreus]